MTDVHPASPKRSAARANASTPARCSASTAMTVPPTTSALRVPHAVAAYACPPAQRFAAPLAPPRAPPAPAAAAGLPRPRTRYVLYPGSLSTRKACPSLSNSQHSLDKGLTSFRVDRTWCATTSSLSRTSAPSIASRQPFTSQCHTFTSHPWPPWRDHSAGPYLSDPLLAASLVWSCSVSSPPVRSRSTGCTRRRTPCPSLACARSSAAALRQTLMVPWAATLGLAVQYRRDNCSGLA